MFKIVSSSGSLCKYSFINFSLHSDRFRVGACTLRHRLRLRRAWCCGRSCRTSHADRTSRRTRCALVSS